MITDLLILLDNRQHVSKLRRNSLKWYPHNKANFLQWTRRPLYANHFGTSMNDFQCGAVRRWNDIIHISGVEHNNSTTYGRICVRVDLRQSGVCLTRQQRGQFKDALFSWDYEDALPHKCFLMHRICWNPFTFQLWFTAYCVVTLQAAWNTPRPTVGYCWILNWKGQEGHAP